MATLVIEVDQREVVAALKKLNDSIDKVAKNTERSFNKANKSVGGLISPLGAATAGAVALSAAFTALAVAAVAAFLDITKGAISLNKEAELTQLSLIAIFEGNEKAADAFVDTIGELAIKLGTSRTELAKLAKGILPDVGGIEATAELLENVIVLGRDAGQEILSIRIATEEALSGNLQSLGRRLNIPRKTLESIREYNKSMGLADAINKGLAERILETGIGADITADSFTTLEGKIRGQFETLQRELGVTPFEELKEEAQAFLELFEEKGPEITRVAQAFGDLAANVIDFIGTNLTGFIESIDFEGVEDLVDSFNRALAAGRLVADLLFELPDTNEGIRDLTSAIKATQVALEALAQKAKLARIALQATFNAAQLIFALKSADLTGALDAIADLGDIASVEKVEATAKNAEEAFADYEKRIKSLDEAQKSRRDSTDKSTESDIAAGEAVLANKKALAELADAQLAAGKAQEEISKKTAGLEEDRQKRLTDIIRKEAQKRFDDEIKSAQRREDIARKNADAIEDIFRDQEQRIADTGRDLSREEQDIARKGARDRRDIERDAANERVDIERNFRQELQNIQRQFNKSAQDAERTNDAQAFLQAVRARDEQVEVAKSERDVGIEDVGRNAQEQRAALKVQLAQEVEDAKIANTRKLEDLQRRLNQEFEAQAIKNERDLEQQAIQEQRQQEKRDLAAQRTLENFERTEAEKQAKLNESLSKQLATIEAAKAKEIEVTARAEAQKTAIVEAEVAKRRTALAAQATAQEQAGAGALPLAPTSSGSGALLPFQSGGRPPVGRPVRVGEAGPEIFVPDRAGTIIPNNAIFSPPAQALPLTQMSSSVTNNSPTFNLAESMFQDPIARRNLTNFVLGVLAERV